MRLSIVDLNGKKAGAATVDDAVWGAEPNPKLVAQAVRVYRSNLRQGEAWTKNRSGINRTGRKMWKQKGTGRARHGDRTAPQFVGGAKAHGPTGEENYKLRINRKMGRRALWSALSDAVRGGKVIVIDKLPGAKKTGELAKALERISSSGERKDLILSVLIVAEKLAPETVRAGRNLGGVTLARPGDLNTLTVLEHDRLVIEKEALKVIGVEGRRKKEEGKRKTGA